MHGCRTPTRMVQPARKSTQVKPALAAIPHPSPTERLRILPLLRRQNWHWLDGSIFYGVLTLIALAAVPYGTVDPWWEALFEFAVFGFTALWLVEGYLRGKWWGREHWFLVPLFAIVLFAFAQSLSLWKYDGPIALGGMALNRAISADPFETWRFAFKLLALTLTFGLLLRYASTERRLRQTIYLVVGIALASALFGLLRSEFTFSLPGLAGDRLSNGYAQFENRNHFAFLPEMAIGLLLGLTVADRNNRKRLIVYLLSGAVLWAALLLTHSRGGTISLLVEVPFFFLLLSTVRVVSPVEKEKPLELPSPKRSHGRQFIATLVLASLLLVAVGASVVLIGGDRTISRLELTRSEFNSRSNGPPKLLRPQIWRATLRLIKDNPLVGVGFAGYSMAIPRYLNASGDWMIEQAHNDYLELLASGGLIGGLLSLWFVGSFVRAARERLREASPSSRAVRCGALAGLFAVAVHSFFDFGLHITINALVCSILIVLTVRACDRKSSPGYEKTA